MPTDFERLLIEYVSDASYTPVKPGILARQLGLKGPAKHQLHEALDTLLASGRLREDKKGRIVPKSVQGAIVGTIKKIAAGGAYLIPHPDRAGEKIDDVFVPAEDLRDAHTGDEVLVRLSRRRGHGGKRYGRVEEILNRATAAFVGTYVERSGRGFVRVDGTQFESAIPVGDPGAKGAQPNDKVVIEMLRFPTHALAGEAVLTRVLGPAGEPEVDTLSIIAEFGLPEEFSEEAVDQAAAAAKDFEENELGSRLDLTKETIITIDPVDARDFDDAISLKRSEDGHWHLGVHIADVAHFVTPGSPLDDEAKRRGTSVYLPGRVIPMLPEVISNGLASLQQDRVRFTKSAFIEFDAEGRVLHTEFANSAIKVVRRFAYEQVMPIVREPNNHDDVPHDVRKLLGEMYELAMILRRRRFEAGALELDLVETKVVVDRAGHVTGVKTVEHDESHQIIEEFMLAANTAVATTLMDLHVPFIRRAHGDPDEEKLRLFAEFVGTLGYPLKKFQSRPDLQKLIREVRGEPTEHAVNYALLRSLKQAVYTVEEEGHYALAVANYCHFTSPIRRYADLTVHRLIGEMTAGRKKPKGLSAEQLATIARRCSDLSRKAEAAERELVKIKLLRFMADKVGDEMDAVITGVERFGVFCRGLEIPVEGLIHITALGAAAKEIFDFDEAAHALVARTSGWTFQLGRPLRVKIARVDIDARKLEFAPADEAPPPSNPQGRRSQGERPSPQNPNGRQGRQSRKAKAKSSRPPQSRQPGRRRRGR
ncbi:MAG: ribonuclease R [Planctomycetota bacterium]|nr:ribonuclease R [Planctomycetaceae bacterium]MDQ3330572.1 ribonuclease R [Planctomycetota bacterium]